MFLNVTHHVHACEDEDAAEEEDQPVERPFKKKKKVTSRTVKGQM